MDTQPWRFPEPSPPPRGAAARPANVMRPLTPREMAEKRAEETEQVEVAPGVAITVSKPVTAEKRQQLIDAYQDAAYNARGVRAFTSGDFTVEYPQRVIPARDALAPFELRGSALVVTQLPTAAFTDGAEPKPVQELQTPEIQTWGGDSVMALRAPRRRLGDNPFSDSNWAAATELSAEDAAKQRREMPEPTDTPASPDSDEPLHSHRRYPISEFTAVCACPRCGWIDVHWLRPPELPQPEPEPAVIRECAKCQQEWGEK